MGNGPRVITCEAVCDGHPDRLADCIADAVVDAALSQSAASRVACEVLVTKGLVVIAGEVTCPERLNYESIVRNALRYVGYTTEESGICADECKVLVSVHQQVPAIAQLANNLLVSDQGVVYGFATKESEQYLPLPLLLARSITSHLSDMRRSHAMPYLLPDGKAQVSVRYEDSVAQGVVDVIVSPHYDGSVPESQVTQDIRNLVLPIAISASLWGSDTKVAIWPYVIGGPASDTGVTGRKLITDTYGCGIPHGGGALSGKDPTKVDRSGSYLARNIAMHVVASDLATECLVQIAFTKGQPDPVDISIDLPQDAQVGSAEVVELVKTRYDLTLEGVIHDLQLATPQYFDATLHGQFGNGHTWERLNHLVSWQRQLEQVPVDSSVVRAAEGGE